MQTSFLHHLLFVFGKSQSVIRFRTDFIGLLSKWVVVSEKA